MDRTHAPGATIDNKYTEGNPSMGVPATTVSAVALNAFQEELVGIIEAAGIVPSEADNTQVLDALNTLYQPAGSIVALAARVTTLEDTRQAQGGGTSTGASVTLATLTLPAGRWLISADAFFKVVASTMTVAVIETSVGGSGEGDRPAVWSGSLTNASQTVARGPRIVTLGASTVVTLSGFATSTGTVEVDGWLTAQRLKDA